MRAPPTYPDYAPSSAAARRRHSCAPFSSSAMRKSLDFAKCAYAHFPSIPMALSARSTACACHRLPAMDALRFEKRAMWTLHSDMAMLAYVFARGSILAAL